MRRKNRLPTGNWLPSRRTMTRTGTRGWCKYDDSRNLTVSGGDAPPDGAEFVAFYRYLAYAGTLM